MASAVEIFKQLEMPKKAGTYYRLLCLTGELKGESYFFIGQRAVMGRSDKCDITIHDLKSSREHAEIIKVNGKYIISDLGSQNGVVVNDQKIKQHSLEESDKIIIGKTVYKFGKVIIKEKGEKKKNNLKEKTLKITEVSNEDKPKNNKLTLILGALVIISIALLGGDSSDLPPKKQKEQIREVKEIDNAFAKVIKKNKHDLKMNKQKLNIYFKRGLREYREGNFFRAISEFESAQQWNPKDPLPNFYLRKTKEKLEEQIESLFSKAIRDVDSINYSKASTSYCAVIRLLSQMPKDPRYLSAKEGIKNLEKKMGLEEGEIVCVDKKRDE